MQNADELYGKMVTFYSTNYWSSLTEILIIVFPWKKQMNVLFFQCCFLKKQCCFFKKQHLIDNLMSVCCLKERDVFIYAAFHHSQEKSDFRAFCQKVRWVFHLADWGLCPAWLIVDLLFPHWVASLFSAAGCRRLLETWRLAEYLNRLVHGNVRIKESIESC